MASANEKIIREAKERYKRCVEYEDDARRHWLDDVKFANGDDINGWQWDQGAVQDRGERPCLTVNKTRAHVLLVVNDARQNKAAIKFSPTGNDATYEAAQIFEGLARRIEYQSQATQAYDKATWDQVQGGIGYWRVVTRYVDQDSMDQDIYIDRVADALSVYIDPDIEHYDGSDAKFAFVESKLLTELAEKQYPDIQGGASRQTLGISDDTWHGSDYTRIVEYYRVQETTDRLHVLPDGSTMRESEAKDAAEALEQMMPPPPPMALGIDEFGQPLPPPPPPSPVDILRSVSTRSRPVTLEQLMPPPPPPSPVDILRSVSTRSRPVTSSTVEWIKIVGDKVVERKDTVFDTIPIVRCVGEETVIDGKLDRRGHVRAMRDPQRMFNYINSAAAEHIALQPKSPFIAAAQAIEGHEPSWEAANTDNKAVLTYNHMDDAGREIPKPERQQPPVMPQAFIAALQQADQQMMMVTGQYPSELGRPGNETSGVAIQQRQRQGDTATYHYIDHLAAAIRYTGRLILQAAPKVYDTARILKIMGEDGTQSDVHVDPAMQDAHAVVPDPQPPQRTPQGQMPTQQDQAAENVRTLWNPAVGKYAVEADVGPSFGTQRQEAFNAFTQIVAQNKELMAVAGDLMFKNADFPGADEMAERLKRMLPPQARGDGPSPAEQELHQKLQVVLQQGGAMAQHADQEKAALQRQIEQLQGQLKDQGTRAVTADYEAETRRLALVVQAAPDLARIIFRTQASQLFGMPVVPIEQAHSEMDAKHEAEMAAMHAEMQPQPQEAVQ